MEQQNLSISLSLVAVSYALELFIYFVPPIWRERRVTAAISVLLLGFGTGFIVVSSWWPLALVFGILSIYKGFSLLRLVEGRSSPERLHSTGRQAAIYLSVASIFVFGLILTDKVTMEHLQLLCVVIGITLAVTFLVGTIINLKASQPKTSSPMADRDLPTVTIAIPARNETTSLEACLISALASDYPKLEILVLDDCSQDRTAEIIKSFAHDGVRFVLGKAAPEDWLAKNFAYKQLLDQASGEYVLFMGVDVRLHSTSVRNLVQNMMESGELMVSVLPKRTKSGLAAAFVQPMRYFWELAIPRRLKKWPPVLSTCWMINRKAASHAGGFAAVKRAILPERHFARDLGMTYAFWRTGDESVITSHKDYSSQWHTAIRTRYPQLHRRPELVMVQTLGFSAGMLAPFILLFTAQSVLIMVLSAVAVILFTLAHVAITAATNKAASWLAPFNFFFAVILDLVALNISMYLYEFSDVMWKGRNVCIPVMNVIPKLPDIKT